MPRNSAGKKGAAEAVARGGNWPPTPAPNSTTLQAGRYMEELFGPEERGERFTRRLVEDQRRIYAFVYSLVHDCTTADDLVQDVSVTLWQKFDDFAEGTDFFSWAATIARYHVLNWRRKQASGALNLDDASFSALADTAEQVARSRGGRIDALGDCVRQLQTDQQRLIAARYESNLSVKELARQGGKSERAIYKALARIHRLLLECIGRRLSDASC